MTVASSGWSIRGRLTRAVLAVVLLGWVGTILMTLWFLDHEMSEGFDEEMELMAGVMLSSLDTAAAPVVPRVVGVSPEDEDRVIRLSRPDAPVPPAPWAQPGTDGFSDGNGWRVFRLSGDRVVVEVAQNRDWRREELFEAASGLFVLVVPMVLLLLVGITRTLGHTLRPVERMAASIGARGPDDLSPMASADSPRELRPLTAALDGYLARIDDLRQAERRFAANAAHELRTPVAALRARIDGAGGPDRDATLRQLDDLTRRIERLLQLSRSEAGLGLGGGPSDLVQILRLLVDEAARRAGAEIRFDDGDLETLVLPLDPDALAILIRNLIDNALDHGTGPVRVTLRPDATLVVENPTANDRFVDNAFAKGAASRGVGLGLSIVTALAGAMRLRVDKSMAGGIARVTVHFGAA